MTENTNEDSTRMLGRVLANCYQSHQKIRISTLNMIRDIVRKKLEGIKFNETEGKKEEKDFTKKYKDENLLPMLEQCVKEGKVAREEFKWIESCLSVANESASIELKYRRNLLRFVKREQIWTDFGSKIRGFGEVLCAKLIKEFGYCERYDNPAKLFAHTGNGVEEDGKAPRKRKGVEVNYNPNLRTLTWNIGDCLMKLNYGLYRETYDKDKKRQSEIKYPKGVLFKKYGKPYTEECVNLSKGHAHNRALRKMRKLFLSHYWAASREMKGLPTRTPYAIEYLKHDNFITWKDAIAQENKLKVSKELRDN